LIAENTDPFSPILIDDDRRNRQPPKAFVPRNIFMAEKEENMTVKARDSGKEVRESGRKLGNMGPASASNSNEAQRHKLSGKVPPDTGNVKDRMSVKED
jgi:hypothetical protein